MPYCLPIYFIFQQKGFRKHFKLVLLFLIKYIKMKKQVLKCFLKPFKAF